MVESGLIRQYRKSKTKMSTTIKLGRYFCELWWWKMGFEEITKLFIHIISRFRGEISRFGADMNDPDKTYVCQV